MYRTHIMVLCLLFYYYYFFIFLPLVVKIPRVKNYELETKWEWLLIWTVDAEGIVQEHRIKTLDHHGDALKY